MDWLEDYVWAMVAEVVKDPDRLALARLQHRRRGPNPGLTERLEREGRALARLKQQEDRLLDLYAEGDIARDALKRKLDEGRETREEAGRGRHHRG